MIQKVKNKKITFSFILLILIISLFISVSAGGFHLPSEILGGQFSNSNYSFKESVGIGTNTPQKTLEISTKIPYGTAIKDILSLNPNFQSGDSTQKTTLGGISWSINGGNTSIGRINYVLDNPSQHLDSHFEFWTYDRSDSVYLTEKMRISKEGNIGIATSSPSAKLHIKGNQKIQASTGQGATTKMVIPEITPRVSFGNANWGTYFSPPLSSSGEILIGSVNTGALYGYFAKLYWSFGGDDRMFIAEEKLGDSKFDWRLNGNNIEVRDTYNYNTQIVGYVTYVTK